MQDIFISYAREDRALAKKIADALLAARGWSVWWDATLRSGEQFPKRIQEAVTASRAMLVLWSRHSIDSNWVVAEASEGWQRQILVPVLLDDSEPPMPFRQTQARDLSQWRGQSGDAALLGLIDDIQRIHAQGAAVDATELAQRELRRRTAKRKQFVRRTAVAAAAIVVLGVTWLFWQQIQTRKAVTATAEKLAEESGEIRAEVVTLTPEEQKRIWWVHLFEHTNRYDRLELCVLLAIEAYRHQRTARTELALRDALALMPWSDQAIEIGKDEMPQALEFNASGGLLAAGSSVRGTLVWDLERNVIATRIAHGGTGGKETWEDKRGRFVGVRGSIQVIAFNPVQDTIATAGPDQTARLWDARTGRELHQLPHTEIATSVIFDAKGERLASADESGAVCVWNVASGQKLHGTNHGSPVYHLTFSPSGALLASVAMDGTVNVWDSASGARRHRIQANDKIRAVRFDPQEKTLASWGDATRLWNLTTGTELWCINVAVSDLAGVIFDHKIRGLVAGDTDGMITWWDLNECVKLFSVTAGSYVIQMAASTKTRHLVTLDAAREARAWDLDSGRLLKRIPYYPGLSSIAMTRDGQAFATAGNDGMGSRNVLEFIRISPTNLIETACKGLHRNLTRDEWHRYMGGTPYHATCPAIEPARTR